MDKDKRRDQDDTETKKMDNVNNVCYRSLSIDKVSDAIIMEPSHERSNTIAINE